MRRRRNLYLPRRNPYLLRNLCLFGIFVLAVNSLYAEDPAAEAIKGRAVMLDISARVIEQNQVEIWSESRQRLTLPGSPVSIKLVGANVAVMALFTPYLLKQGQNILVAQGQVWIEIPGQGIRYQSTMQTIPIDFDEPIFFFPLGQNGDSAFIEIMLTMKASTETQMENAGTAAEAGKY